MILNIENLILGRVASFIAKKALLGEEIKVVNCKDAVIIGDKRQIMQDIENKKARTTPRKGPFIPKTSERFVKRTIRGMLPYKKERGKLALKRIKCYKAIPEFFKESKIETLEQFNAYKTKNINFTKVQDVCRHIGGN